MNRTIVYISVLFFSVALWSCEYEKLEPIDTTLPENVSFSNDLTPIFENSCNASACHGTGAYQPDLTRDYAYYSLIYGDMIDTINPENSRLYKSMTNLNEPMPVDGLLPVNQRNLVLVWIKEGAKNN